MVERYTCTKGFYDFVNFMFVLFSQMYQCVRVVLVRLFMMDKRMYILLGVGGGGGQRECLNNVHREEQLLFVDFRLCH